MAETRVTSYTDASHDILDVLPCGIVTFNDNGTVTGVNTTLATMLGYERQEVEGKHIESFLTVGSRIFFQTHLYPVVRLHGRADEMFVLLRHKNGTDVGALLNAARHERDGTGAVDCVLMEVRERRKYEDALLRAKQTAESARAEVEARSHQLEIALAKLEQQALELELQQQQLEAQAAELEAQSEELQQTNDELLSRTHELERASGAAEEANRAKSQFLAVMSHELRTPLNAIGGYTQLLEMEVHGPISDAQRETLGRILRAQRHLLGLINDVLNLARIEAGRVDYAIENVHVAELIASVMPMVEPQMASAQLTSSVTVPPDLIVRADREKMQQILINLLTNALKFTGPGGTIAVLSDEDGERARVSVRDSGIGIPAEKLSRVFEPFVQVDPSRTRRQQGSGLGLAISRDLARGMGGDLVATSEEGRGSTFTLVLPRHA